jgi:tetratricopeptide repeat protein 8
LQGVGDVNLATQSLRLALMADPTHAPAYNNLGVMEARLGRTNVAQSLFQASAGLAHVLFEPHYNYALLANEVKILNLIVTFF